MKKRKIYTGLIILVAVLTYASLVITALTKSSSDNTNSVVVHHPGSSNSHIASPMTTTFQSTSAWHYSRHQAPNNISTPSGALGAPDAQFSPISSHLSSASYHSIGGGGGNAFTSSRPFIATTATPSSYATPTLAVSTSLMIVPSGTRTASHNLNAATTIAEEQEIIAANSPMRRSLSGPAYSPDDPFLDEIEEEILEDPIGPLPVIFIFMLLTLYAAPIKARTDTTGVRVMSYNIRVANSGDGDNEWTHRRKATVSMLRDIEPEVFGVQEALPTQINYILGNCTRYRAVGVGREDGKREGEHMSVFYNWYHYRLMDWGTFWLSETPDTPSIGWDAACKRTATWTLLQRRSDGQRLYFVNTHLDHVGELSKQYGLMLIMDSIAVRNTEGYPVILTGDFNMWPNNTTLRVFRRRMEPARFMAEQGDEQGSFNGFGERGDEENPLMPIDYIYYANMSRCLTFRVVTDTYRRVPYISDHYPIYSDLLFH